MMMATIINPVHTPALKIPPIASQLVRVSIHVTNTLQIKRHCFMLVVFNLLVVCFGLMILISSLHYFFYRCYW